MNLDQGAAISIRSSIDKARAQLRVRRCLSILIFMLTIALLAIICTRGVSLYFDGLLPIEYLTVGILSTSALAFAGWVVLIFKQTNPDAEITALWRRSSDPDLDELLRSALELGDGHDEHKTSDTTQSLINRQLQSVLQRLEAADVRGMLPPIVSGRGQLYLAAITLLFLGTFTHVNFWSSFDSPDTVTVKKSWVKGLTLRVQPPAYTELPTKTYENTDGNLTALAGSTVSLTGYVDLPSGYKLSVALPGQNRRMLDAKGSSVEFSFEVSESGPWSFEVYNTSIENGLAETTPRQLVATKDKPPKVILTKPKKDQSVSANALMQLVYTATDDFKLSKSTLVVALDGDIEQAERVELNALATQKTRGAEELDLSLFDIQGGDRVAVFIECSDAKKPTPQVGRSKALYLTIESAENEHQALTLQLKKLIEPFLTDLADRLEFDLQKPILDPLTTLHARGSKTASDAAQIIAELADDPLTPKAVHAVLKSTVVLLQDELLVEANTLTKWRASPTNSFFVSPTAFEPIIGHTEAMVIALEAAVARLSLEDMKALTEEIRVRRERIQDLLSSYKENPDKDLKNRILRNIKRLKQKMEALREKMAQLRQKLPEEFLNLEGLKGSELSETMAEGEQKLDDLEKMLEENRIDEAMKALDELSESLDAFDKLVNQDMETLHREGDPKRQQAISELMDKTRDLMKKQQALLDQTKETAQKGAAAFEKTMNEDGGRPLEEIAAELVQTERQINALQSKKQSERRQARLQQLSTETGKVLDALEKENLPRAIEKIEQAIESSRRMTWDRSGPDHDKDRAINQSLRKSQDAMKKLLSKAKNAQKQAEDSKQTQALSRAQQELKQALAKLNQELGEKGKEMPGLDGKPGQSLKEAGTSMDKARQSLDRAQPSQAPPSQKEAMNALQQTMQNLRQAAKPKPADRNGHGRTRQEKVEIPSGEDYAAPSAFREELLKAMKRKTDDANQDAVKRYYRSLVE